MDIAPPWIVKGCAFDFATVLLLVTFVGAGSAVAGQAGDILLDDSFAIGVSFVELFQP